MNHNRLLSSRTMLTLALLWSLCVCGCRPTAVSGSPREIQTAGAKGSPKMRLWVAAYYYPNGPGLDQWNRLIASAGRVPIVATVNPNSGPGDHLDTNYAAIIPRARKAGLTLVGYIGTQYTRKPLSQVQAEVDAFLRFYPDIQGIHVDEQSSDSAGVGYYAELYRYIRQRIPNALVITNPGTTCVEEYVSRPASDVVCLFERDKEFESFQPPAWVSKYPAARFGVQAYNIDSEARMKQAVREAARKRMGYIYVTDARGSNPYDRLPSYWEAEIAAVQQINRSRF